MIRIPMSKRKADVLRFVRRFIDMNHYPPTLIEIGQGCGMKSGSHVMKVLRALEDDGAIQREHKRARGIRLNHV